jgi:hypothetical protein
MMGISVRQTLLVFISILAMLLSSLGLSFPARAVVAVDDGSTQMVHEQHGEDSGCHLAWGDSQFIESNLTNGEKHCPTVSSDLCCSSTCFNTSFAFPSIALPNAHGSTLALLHPDVIGHKISRLQGILKPPITLSFF